MRIATFTMAASLAFAMTDAACAQGVVGGSPVGAYSVERGDAPASAVYRLSIGPRPGSNGNPAGVIDGTNRNPGPTRAGGILSPDGIVNW